MYLKYFSRRERNFQTNVIFQLPQNFTTVKDIFKVLLYTILFSFKASN